MLNFYVYILECRDTSYYVGHTDNLEKRIAEHNVGHYSCYTKRRLPVKLVFVQEFSRRDEALERERQIKGWSRVKKEALIKKDWEELSKLSKNSLKSREFTLRQAQGGRED